MEIFGNLEQVFAGLYPYRWPISTVLLLLLVGAAYGIYRRNWHRVLWQRPLVSAMVIVPLLAIALPVGYYLLSPLWTRTHLEEASPLLLAGAQTTEQRAASSTPALEPAMTPASTPTPEARSTPVPTDAIVATPTTEPMLDPTPAAETPIAPTPEPPPTVQPAPEPTVEPVVEPEPEPVVEAQPEPTVVSAPETVIDPEPTVAPEPVVEPEPEPVVEPEPAVFVPTVISAGEFYGADDFHFGSGTALIIETEPGVYVFRVENFSVQNGPDLFMYLSTNSGGLSEDTLNLGVLKATDGSFNYDIPPGTDISQFQSAIVWCREFAVLFATAPFG